MTISKQPGLPLGCHKLLGVRRIGTGFNKYNDADPQDTYPRGWASIKEGEVVSGASAAEQSTPNSWNYQFGWGVVDDWFYDSDGDTIACGVTSDYWGSYQIYYYKSLVNFTADWYWIGDSVAGSLVTADATTANGAFFAALMRKNDLDGLRWLHPVAVPDGAVFFALYVQDIAEAFDPNWPVPIYRRVLSAALTAPGVVRVTWYAQDDDPESPTFGEMLVDHNQDITLPSTQQSFAMLPCVAGDGASVKFGVWQTASSAEELLTQAQTVITAPISIDRDSAVVKPDLPLYRKSVVTVGALTVEGGSCGMEWTDNITWTELSTGANSADCGWLPVAPDDVVAPGAGDFDLTAATVAPLFTPEYLKGAANRQVYSVSPTGAHPMNPDMETMTGTCTEAGTNATGAYSIIDDTQEWANGMLDGAIVTINPGTTNAECREVVASPANDWKQLSVNYPWINDPDVGTPFDIAYGGICASTKVWFEGDWADFRQRIWYHNQLGGCIWERTNGAAVGEKRFVKFLDRGVDPADVANKSISNVTGTSFKVGVSLSAADLLRARGGRAWIIPTSGTAVSVDVVNAAASGSSTVFTTKTWTPAVGKSYTKCDVFFGARLHPEVRFSDWGGAGDGDTFRITSRSMAFALSSVTGFAGTAEPGVSAYLQTLLDSKGPYPTVKKKIGYPEASFPLDESALQSPEDFPAGSSEFGRQEGETPPPPRYRRFAMTPTIGAGDVPNWTDNYWHTDYYWAPAYLARQPYTISQVVKRRNSTYTVDYQPDETNHPGMPYVVTQTNESLPDVTIDMAVWTDRGMAKFVYSGGGSFANGTSENSMVGAPLLGFARDKSTGDAQPLQIVQALPWQETAQTTPGNFHPSVSYTSYNVATASPAGDVNAAIRALMPVPIVVGASDFSYYVADQSAVFWLQVGTVQLLPLPNLLTLSQADDTAGEWNWHYTCTNVDIFASTVAVATVGTSGTWPNSTSALSSYDTTLRSVFFSNSGGPLYLGGGFCAHANTGYAVVVEDRITYTSAAGHSWTQTIDKQLWNDGAMAWNAMVTSVSGAGRDSANAGLKGAWCTITPGNALGDSIVNAGCWTFKGTSYTFTEPQACDIVGSNGEQLASIQLFDRSTSATETVTLATLTYQQGPLTKPLF